MVQPGLVPLELADYATACCAYRDCGNPVLVLRNRYCAQHASTTRRNNARDARRHAHQVEFCGVDGEGDDDTYLLLGVGGRHAAWPRGPETIDDIFTFLWDCFLAAPRAVYCGFYLSYDFNMWLKMLPRERAERLLTDQGVATRQRRVKNGNPDPFPARYRDWEFDMLGNGKRFKLRRAGAGTWMYVNDAGPFFGTSLLKAIDPAAWPDPVVTPAEYDALVQGKARRDRVVLGEQLIAYNALENDVLARLLARLNAGLTAMGVRLRRDQWYGPGQAAQQWMAAQRPLRRAVTAVREHYPPALQQALRASYYGGRFEIAAHGIVPGQSWEYDINSAYPAAIAALPCACGSWRHGTAKPPPRGGMVLVHGRAEGGSPHLGGLPYRRANGDILFPNVTVGWYWAHEVRAARRAGLVQYADVDEWWAYRPCGHPPPLAAIAGLYERRLAAGKNTPEGKACKLVYNSVYGKFAQSVGEPRFASALYASLITAACRAQVLDAIATHPGKAAAVLMIATDGVYFAGPHPGLPVSGRLGEWEAAEHGRLTLFKPGVYWDDAARQRIREGRDVAFKARGISARDFSAKIGEVDEEFALWPPASWPKVTFTASFAQVSCKQALAETRQRPWAYKSRAGKVIRDFQMVQDSDPSVKRDVSVMRFAGGAWRSRPHRRGPDNHGESTPYERKFGFDPDILDAAEVNNGDTPIELALREALGVG